MLLSCGSSTAAAHPLVRTRAKNRLCRSYAHTSRAFAVMEQKQVNDKTVAGTDVTLCYGAFPFSPIPCCLCCGVGPCKPEFKFVKDPADPTKWVGSDTVFPNCPLGCCKITAGSEHKILLHIVHIAPRPQLVGLRPSTAPQI